MHRNTLFALSAVALTALGLVASPVRAEDEKKQGRLLIGPQLGFYTPSDGLARSRFGGAWTNIGFGFGDVSAPKAKGELNFDVNFMSSRASQSEVLLAPIGVVYRKSISENHRTRPYFGVSADWLVTSMRSDILLDQIPSGIRTGAGGSFFGGLTMGNSFYIEGRFYTFSKIRGFDFSGTNIALGWRL